MRKITTVLVALTVLLAGCSFGGTGGTPTANETASTPGALADTTVNDVPGVADGSVTNASAMLAAFEEEAYAGPADLQFSVESANSSYTYRYRNDTEQQLYEVSRGNQSGTTTYYVTNGTDAVRNTTSGETRYGDEQYGISSNARFTLFLPQVYVSLVEVLEWEPAGTTTVDGEQRYVFESDSINDTLAEEEGWTISDADTTVDGRLTVGADGVIRSGTLDLQAEDGYANITFSLETDESIDVTQPGWFDESEAN